jgi:hypothetical protein
VSRKRANLHLLPQAVGAESSAQLSKSETLPYVVVGVPDVNDDGEVRRNVQNGYSYPQAAVDGVLADLRAWGVCGTRRLLREHDLEDIAYAIADVKAAIEAGKQSGEYVVNPAGLFIWTLRQEAE